MVGFEAEPAARARDLLPLRPAPWAGAAGGPVVAHLVVEDARGRQATPVLTAPWGGMALAPYVLEPGPAGRFRWILDPFAFLTAALHLPVLPAPDPTTENGLRILLSEIDGDGFANAANRPGRPFAAEVIGSEILDRYRLPTTVSIVEGECGAKEAKVVAEVQETVAAASR